MTVTHTEEELQTLCREWQGVLRLQDWTVRVLVVPAADIDHDKAHVRRPTANKRLAVIEICDPTELAEQADDPDQEVSLVHELLHLHLWEMADALESLSYELGSVAMSPVSMARRQHEQAEERAVWALAYALVGLKRAGRMH